MLSVRHIMFNINKNLQFYSVFSVIIVIICATSFASSYEERDEGSSCPSGMCKKAINCPVAIDALRRGKPHQLIRCGFVGLNEIVCCPEHNIRSPSIETTVTDSSLIWANTVKPTQTDDNTKGGNTGGRIKSKRICEIMCEKVYRELRIQPEIDFHVLNGEDAKIGQFPHMAALGYQSDADDGTINWKRCGAALISPRFLLTAAHCLYCVSCVDRPPIKVRFGVTDLRDEKTAQDIDIKNITAHEHYNYDTNHNDIAVVELVKDVHMGKTVFPACLYTEANDPLEMQITGWGQTDQNNVSSVTDILQHATIEPVATDNCNITIRSLNRHSAKTIVESQICAISKSDTCVGDSGGPLQITNSKGGFDIVGIVSYGIGCGTAVPGIYTRVSAFLDWIEGKVWPGNRVLEDYERVSFSVLFLPVK